ncbi:hypothetical protein TNCV_3885981 [Trichonephila clavipes]|nr:hypothetical protein TNCV_3885981 [Trichonephila clavipes]
MEHGAVNHVKLGKIEVEVVVKKTMNQTGSSQLNERIWSTMVGLKKLPRMKISHFSRSRNLIVCGSCTIVHQYIFASVVWNHLHATYPGKWLGRGGPVVLPLHSSNLNHLDFFWGHLKLLVYETPVVAVEVSQIELPHFS